MDLAKQTALKSNCSNSTAVHDWSAIEACLAGKSADELVALEGIIKKDLAADILQAMQLFMPFPPTYGTPFLPERPLVAFQAGSVIDVPIMVGNVHDEAVGFIYGAFGQPVDAKVRRPSRRTIANMRMWHSTASTPPRRSTPTSSRSSPAVRRTLLRFRSSVRGPVAVPIG